MSSEGQSQKNSRGNTRGSGRSSVVIEDGVVLDISPQKEETKTHNRRLSNSWDTLKSSVEWGWEGAKEVKPNRPPRSSVHQKSLFQTAKDKVSLGSKTKKLKSILKNGPTFSSFDDEVLDDLIERLKERNFIKGETLFTIGDPGKSFYIVMWGTVGIIIDQTDPGESEMIPDAFPPVGKFDNVVVTSAGVQRFVTKEQGSYTAVELQDHEDQMDELNDQIRTNEFKFLNLQSNMKRPFTPDIEFSARKLKKKILDDELSTTELKMSSEEKLSHTPGIIAATLRNGETFGELALLSGDKRAATAQCFTTCVILELDKKDFDYIVSDRLQERKNQTEKLILHTIPGAINASHTIFLQFSLCFKSHIYHHGYHFYDQCVPIHTVPEDDRKLYLIRNGEAEVLYTPQLKRCTFASKSYGETDDTESILAQTIYMLLQGLSREDARALVEEKRIDPNPGKQRENVCGEEAFEMVYKNTNLEQHNISNLGERTFFGYFAGVLNIDEPFTIRCKSPTIELLSINVINYKQRCPPQVRNSMNEHIIDYINFTNKRLHLFHEEREKKKEDKKNIRLQLKNRYKGLDHSPFLAQKSQTLQDWKLNELREQNKDWIASEENRCAPARTHENFYSNPHPHLVDKIHGSKRGWVNNNEQIAGQRQQFFMARYLKNKKKKEEGESAQTTPESVRIVSKSISPSSVLQPTPGFSPLSQTGNNAGSSLKKSNSAFNLSQVPGILHSCTASYSSTQTAPICIQKKMTRKNIPFLDVKFEQVDFNKMNQRLL